MSYRWLKVLTVLVPTVVIGGFEFIRHEFLLESFSMEAGNYIIIALTFIISYLFAIWMFGTIERKNRQLAEEKSSRAVYEERERLARELHDKIAQNLFFLNVQLKQGKVEGARAAVSELDTHLRQAIFNLRSSPVEGQRFTERIQRWVDEWEVISGIKVKSRIELPDHYFPPASEVQLFALIQEAFTNIRKHSQAQHADLQLTSGPGGWLLHIRDDGVGLGLKKEEQQRYGVSMMEKRARELEADFRLMSRPGGGTELEVKSKGGV